jgi:hypothetical protein
MKSRQQQHLQTHLEQLLEQRGPLARQLKGRVHVLLHEALKDALQLPHPRKVPLHAVNHVAVPRPRRLLQRLADAP